MSRKFNVTMTTNAMCPKRKEITEAIQNSSGIKAKVVIGAEKTGVGQYPVCLDVLKDENKFAVIKEINDGKNAVPDEEIPGILSSDYTVTITGVEPDGKVITATLEISNAKATVERKTSVSADIQAMIDEKVSEGIISAEEAEKKVAVMLKNYVDEGLMKAVISGWKKYKKPVHGLRCEYVDPYLEDYRKAGKQGLIAHELRNAVNRFPVIMEGEKSVGKNVFVETIAWLLNMPLFLITFSRNMSPSSVYGEKSTDNSASEYFKTETAQKAAKAENRIEKIDNSINSIQQLFLDQEMKKPEFYKKFENFVEECVKKGDMEALVGGKTECAIRMLEKSNPFYCKAMTELMKERESAEKAEAEFKVKSAQAQSVNIIIDQSELYDWLESGGLMVFNEMNMAEPNFFASFTNQLTDGTGFLFIPGRGEVKINPDCVLCGTQNADYEGVEQQNEATMSRFGCISFEQPKSIKGQLKVAVEAELLRRGYSQKLDMKNIDMVEKFYNQCRKAVNKGDFTNAVLNIRGFVRALTLVTSSDGNLSLLDAVEQHVINTCPVDERQPLKSTASTVFGGF